MKKKDMIITSVIIGLFVLIIAILFFLPGEEKKFDIKDRCGPIVNLISHTIASESACRIQCESKCKTNDLKYSKVEFIEKSVGCHDCTCYCRE